MPRAVVGMPSRTRTAATCGQLRSVLLLVAITWMMDNYPECRRSDEQRESGDDQ